MFCGCVTSSVIFENFQFENFHGFVEVSKLVLSFITIYKCQKKKQTKNYPPKTWIQYNQQPEKAYDL